MEEKWLTKEGLKKKIRINEWMRKKTGNDGDIRGEGRKWEDEGTEEERKEKRGEMREEKLQGKEERRNGEKRR